MEDRSKYVFDDSHLPHAYFGVFDGHGGEEAAVRLICCPPPVPVCGAARGGFEFNLED